MIQFIESLCRLYKNNKINNEKLKQLLADKTITQQEYECILAVKNEK